MDNPNFIHGHYDGEIFVADEPVPYPVDQPVLIQPDNWTKETKSGKIAADSTPEERMKAFEKLLELSANDPIIPLKALRRDTDNDDEGYGY